jgi:hypothetical protein
MKRIGRIKADFYIFCKIRKIRPIRFIRVLSLLSGNPFNL